MKKVLFSLITLAFLVTSCGPSVTVFNETIVKAHETALNAQNDFNTKLQDAVSADTYTSVKAAGDEAITKIDESITKVKDLGVPSGGEKLRDLSLEVFEMAKQLVNVGVKFSALPEDASDDDKNKIIEEYSDLMDKASDKEDEMIKAQADFAAEKGITLK